MAWCTFQCAWYMSAFASVLCVQISWPTDHLLVQPLELFGCGSMESGKQPCRYTVVCLILCKSPPQWSGRLWGITGSDSRLDRSKSNRLHVDILRFLLHWNWGILYKFLKYDRYFSCSLELQPVISQSSAGSFATNRWFSTIIGQPNRSWILQPGRQSGLRPWCRCKIATHHA